MTTFTKYTAKEGKVLPSYKIVDTQYSNGGRRGHSSSGISYVLPDEKQKQEYDRQLAADRMKHINFNNLTLSQLQRISEIINKQQQWKQ